MRPIASTCGRLDAEHRTRPTAPAMLMWVKCQSVATPSTAEYWHIGDTTMRLCKRQAAQLDRGKQGAHAGSSGGRKSDRMKFRSPRLCQPAGGSPPRGAMHCARHMISGRSAAAVSRTTSSSISVGLSGIGSIPSFFRLACSPDRPAPLTPASSSSSKIPGAGLPMRMRPSGNSSPSAPAENWIVVAAAVALRWPCRAGRAFRRARCRRARTRDTR